MKQMIIAVLLLTSMICNAQSEDCRTKLTATVNTITISNKSTCPTAYRIEIPKTSDSVTTVVNSGECLTLCISFCGEIIVTPIVNCELCMCDYEAVKLNNDCNPLPLGISHLSMQQDGRELTVSFTVEDITNVKDFIIETTTDGITFDKLAVIIPTNIQVGKETALHYTLK